MYSWNYIIFIVASVYEDDIIQERHRHRYEYNNEYKDQLEAAGGSQRRKHQHQDAVKVRLTLEAMQRSGPSPSRDAPRDAIDESWSVFAQAITPPEEGIDKRLENSTNIHPSRRGSPHRNRRANDQNP